MIPHDVRVHQPVERLHPAGEPWGCAVVAVAILAAILFLIIGVL